MKTKLKTFKDCYAGGNRSLWPIDPNCKCKHKVGEVITLDCGYKWQTDDQKCVILQITEGQGVFGDPKWNLYVRIIGRDEYFTTDIEKKIK